MRRSVAPVNAPFSCPNSSDSSSSAAIAEVLSAMNGPSARGELSCSARDTSSLPVPDSPVISTVMLERDSRPIALNTSCIAGAWPMIRGTGFDCSCSAVPRLALPRRPRHELHRFVDVERLRQIFERAALIGGHRAVEIRMRGDHDHRDVGIGSRQAFHELEAAHVGHPYVGDQHVGPVALERVEELPAGLEATRNHVRLLERLLEHPAHGLVVVDDPDARARRGHQPAPSACGSWPFTHGSRSWNTVRPGWLMNSIRPPLRLTSPARS